VTQDPRLAVIVGGVFVASNTSTPRLRMSILRENGFDIWRHFLVIHVTFFPTSSMVTLTLLQGGTVSRYTRALDGFLGSFTLVSPRD